MRVRRAKWGLFVLFAIMMFVGLSVCRCGSHSSTQAKAADDDAGDDASPDDDDNDDAAMTFPEGFLFGSATAGFQVDMACPTIPASLCTDPHSDWYQFVTSPTIIHDPLAYVKGDDPAKVSPGHWELFASDFDRAKNGLHNNAFRMSIEWSRIFPKSTIGVEGYENLLAIADADAVAHYHQVFADLRARGLEPLVTLNHYTLPTWIHDAVGCHTDFAHCSPRGWVDADTTVNEIAKYAGFVAREYGGQVDLWTTLNEPFAVVLPGYLFPSKSRSNPPAVFLQFAAFKTAFAAMIQAHARMVDAIRANDLVSARGNGQPAAEVGIVYSMSPAFPKDPNSALDKQAAANVFYIWNMVFLNAVALGQFDENFDHQPVYHPELAGRMDFIGVNYYTCVMVSGLPFSIAPWMSPLFTFNPLTLDFGALYPRGIYEMSEIVKNDFHLPVYITENNARNDPHDTWAEEYRAMVEHLSWLWYAMQQGVDVRGYFYWALLDNYEWNQGYCQDGLYGVAANDPTKQRVTRDIDALYAEIAGDNGVPPNLSSEYPVNFAAPAGAGLYGRGK